MVKYKTFVDKQKVLHLEQEYITTAICNTLEIHETFQNILKYPNNA